MAQLMPLPLTVTCFSKIQIGFTFLALAHQVVPESVPLNWCVCVSHLALTVLTWVPCCSRTYFVSVVERRNDATGFSGLGVSRAKFPQR